MDKEILIGSIIGYLVIFGFLIGFIAGWLWDKYFNKD